MVSLSDQGLLFVLMDQRAFRTSLVVITKLGNAEVRHVSAIIVTGVGGKSGKTDSIN